MKLVVTTISLLISTSALKAQENPVFRQRKTESWLVDKKPSLWQQRPQTYGDTLRGIIIPQNSLVYTMPVVKPDIVYTMPNVAHTPQYKATMLELYGRTEAAVKPR